jgi:phosphatidylglycerol:prolipoprotein diacylglycerol transferase
VTFAAIPYTTFPLIELGPLHLRTFGVAVGAGVLIGAWVAARTLERIEISREDTYRLATRMVVFGVIGARIAWDISHWSEIDSPIDLIAVWNGGLQFAGGFIAAILVGFPVFRRWDRTRRWRVLDGYAYGLTIGLAIGRIGCYAVGEHLGRDTTSFFLATRYDGGATREGPPAIGDVIHNTSLYEMLHLLVLFGLLTWLYRRRPGPGVIMGVFCLWYGVTRFLTDFLRGYDEKVLGLTGAQWMCVALIPTGLWILTRVSPTLSKLRSIPGPEPEIERQNEET